MTGFAAILLYLLQYLKTGDSKTGQYLILLIIFSTAALFILFGNYIQVYVGINIYIYIVLLSVYILWFPVFFYFIPRVLYSFIGKPFPKGIKIFSLGFSLTILLMLFFTLIILHNPRMIYWALIFEIKSIINILFTVIYTVITIILLKEYKTVKDPIILGGLHKAGILSLIFIPVLVFEVIIIPLNQDFKLIPIDNFFTLLIYSLWNILSITGFYKVVMLKEKLVSHEKSSLSHLDSYMVTPREKEIIKKLITGKSYQEIADELFISYPTVKSHVYNIYNKLGIKNKIEMIQMVNKQ